MYRPQNPEGILENYLEGEGGRGTTKSLFTYDLLAAGVALRSAIGMVQVLAFQHHHHSNKHTIYEDPLTANLEIACGTVMELWPECLTPYSTSYNVALHFPPDIFTVIWSAHLYNYIVNCCV